MRDDFRFRTFRDNNIVLDFSSSNITVVTGNIAS